MQFPVKTTCPYCGVGCGLLVNKDSNGAYTVKGDPQHPANEGRICSKGSALAETLDSSGRLLYPEIDGQQVNWDTATSTIASRFREILDEHGPEAIAFYVSGQLLTEDYYVANKLMKGFIGSANIDTNSRLCMSSAVAAYKRAFGEDIVPCSYRDIETADMVVITGANIAWCHPVIYQRLAKAKKDNPELLIVNIDPRRTQTTDIADLHLPLKPGSDATLFNGLLVYLEQQGKLDPAFLDKHANGTDATLASARASSPDCETVATACELPLEDIKRFYQQFSDTESVVTLFSQGINQSSSGVDKGNALINCHLLSGRIGRPGMGPFSLTGQPNAMGGREVGGLSNQLAAHMDLENTAHRTLVQAYWSSPLVADTPGYKAVDLFEAVHTGKIKAIWIMATNPVVSLPNADRVAEALQSCDCVIVSDAMGNTDTIAYADIRLPAMTWGERDGTVTNSERCISRQRPFLSPAGEARADWWMLAQVAQKMGFPEAFNYSTSAEIFSEHAGLSGYQNEGERLFDISALSQLDQSGYDSLSPTQWPASSNMASTAHLFTARGFSTPDTKARLVPITPRSPESRTSADFPYTLNTGRVRDHWHTMTRTGLSTRLSSHRAEPFVEIHPKDAVREGLEDGTLAEVFSKHGSVIVRVSISERQRAGSLFVPMHWNANYSSSGRVGTLVAGNTDPISGQPESKHSVAAIRPYKTEWNGFILTRRDNLSLDYASYWCRSRGKQLWAFEIAGHDAPSDWGRRARHLLCKEDEDVNWIEYYDQGTGHYRAARFTGETLESCIFIGATQTLPPRDWLQSLFEKQQLDNRERMVLLSGKPPGMQEDAGRIICSCFSIGENKIRNVIEQYGMKTTDEIGACLQAGTNCGSCLPELQELIDNSALSNNKAVASSND